MKRIFLIGAGRSSTYLIKYLLEESKKKDWELLIGEKDIELARSKIGAHSNGKAISFDIDDKNLAEGIIETTDVVISMLPAHMHLKAAEICLEKGKHFLTASYRSEDIEALDNKVKEKDLLFLMEMGLDPGIDHMSAMKIIDQIRDDGHYLHTFETFTGGLLAPSLDKENPWNYKFTWNPRNVVLAGQGGVKFIQESRYKYIPYHRLFRRTEKLFIPDFGYFDGYANRDSLKYRKVYNLEDVKTLYRGTLRAPGYCRAWNNLIQLGATDDSYIMEGSDHMTHREFINSFLHFNPNDSVELKTAQYLNLDIEGDEMHMLKWLGLFDFDKIDFGGKGTPAQLLEHILKKKWTLNPDDRDMIVMLHRFVYVERGEVDTMKEIQSHMVVLGENEEDTGMAKTVGLPLAIATKLLLEGKIKARGVTIPTRPTIYNPVLEELESVGIKFHSRMINSEEAVPYEG